MLYNVPIALKIGGKRHLVVVVKAYLGNKSDISISMISTGGIGAKIPDRQRIPAVRLCTAWRRGKLTTGTRGVVSRRL